MTSVRFKRIAWQCRRGMLELDSLLQCFAEHQLESLGENKLRDFERLLQHTDEELQQWLLNGDKPADRELAQIAQFVRSSFQT